MVNQYQLTHWIKLYPNLIPYEVTGLCVFPIFGKLGSLTAQNAVFLAKSKEDFPEYDFPNEPGISVDGKVYALILKGGCHYAYDDIAAMLAEAETALTSTGRGVMQSFGSLGISA